jgi:hypothetical protein
MDMDKKEFLWRKTLFDAVVSPWSSKEWRDFCWRNLFFDESVVSFNNYDDESDSK